MAMTLRRQDDQTTRWEPFEEVERMRTEFARLLEGSGAFASVPGIAFIPPADVEETDDAYIIELEVPGIPREDIEVQISGGRLIVSGERKEKERVGLLRKRTRRVGRFQYEIQLPSDVDGQNVSAHLEHGELTIRVPKSSGDRPRRISVD
jgi:HSP20 family protein